MRYYLFPVLYALAWTAAAAVVLWALRKGMKAILGRSELHGAIQDSFNEAGVKILSPSYSAMRDGNATTIPGQEERPMRAFRVRKIEE